jgi:hypothetical protein
MAKVVAIEIGQIQINAIDAGVYEVCPATLLVRKARN